MLADFAYPSLMVPLLAFFISRSMVRTFGARLGSAAKALPVILGSLTAASFGAFGFDSPSLWAGDFYGVVADAACAIAMLVIGIEAGYSRRQRINKTASAPRMLRQAAALAVPAAIAIALAFGFGAFNRSGTLPIVRTALALAAALWLSTERNGPGLLAAGLAIAFIGSGGAPPFMAVAASTGFILALLAIGASGRAVGSIPALALGLAWSLRACGASWPAAGLAAGFSGGLAWRAIAERPGGTSSRPPAPEGAGKTVFESMHALAFVTGLGLSPARLVGALPAIAIVAVAILASAMAHGLAKGTRGMALPTEAAIFVALLAAKQAGLVSDAAMVGAVVAFLVAAPFAVLRQSQVAGSDARAIKAIVGISSGDQDRGAITFASALAAPDDPVRAICVVGSPGSAGPSSTQAEEALVRCVVAGTSMGVHVLPSVVSDGSVAAGLARVARERRADAIILGSGNRSRSILDELLGQYSGSVIAIRRPAAYAASRRLVILAVSGAETAHGFAPAVRAAARAWGRPSRAIDAMMVGSRASALVDASEGAIDPGSTLSVQSWRDVPAALEALASQKLGFVVFSARPGSKAWNPGHDRLPVVLDAAFPESAIALWYAATEPSAAAEGQGVPHELSRPEAGTWPPLVAAAFDSGRILPDMREAAMVDAIRRLTDAVYPADRGASGRLAAEFSGIARKEPIELTPGVLLLHAHARGVSMPTLAIGSRPAGWPLVALSSPVRVTVVLVSPLDSGPESHLEALTQIAAAFRNLGLADRLLGGSAVPSMLSGETPPSLEF
ncbi:MAG: hypothetical protein CVV51_10570 [Spirochaetae bacterium HGW-Spirochaetae-7]|jgi:hypothetical protein|nr:MAG: hypothetical protein CVV51_10570 [Spirochaetae bacterium HGW-Spirochaetae-7]